MPTNYKKLREVLLGRTYSDRTGLLLKGLTWRILKSKDPFVRRENIIGLLMADTLGTRTGAVKELLHGPAMVDTLRLLYYMEHDFYARSHIFANNQVLLDEIVHLLREHYLEPYMLEMLVPMLQIISVRQDLKLQLINHDLIKFYLTLLRDNIDILSENVVEYMVATLLNLSCRQEGVQKFEKQEEVFQILGGLLQCEDSLARVIVNGTIYSLLGRRKLYDQAIRAGLPQVIEYIMQNDPQANIKELRLLQSKIAAFEPAKPTAPSEDSDELMQEDSLMEYQQELGSLEEYIKGHEYLVAEFSLTQRQATLQSQQVRQAFEHSVHQLKQKQAQQRVSNLRKIQPSEHAQDSASIIPRNYLSLAEPAVPRAKSQVEESYKSGISQPSNREKYQSGIHRPEHRVMTQSETQEEDHREKRTNRRHEKVRPREQVLKKVNEQIRASRFFKSGQNEKEIVKIKNNQYDSSKYYTNGNVVNMASPKNSNVSYSNLYKSESVVVEEHDRKAPQRKNREGKDSYSSQVVAGRAGADERPNPQRGVQRATRQKSRQYEQAFGSKPKVRRSPPGSPERHRV